MKLCYFGIKLVLTIYIYENLVSNYRKAKIFFYHNYQVLFVGKPTKRRYSGTLGNINDVTKHGSMVSIFICYY